jgi:hypothetical protein
MSQDMLSLLRMLQNCAQFSQHLSMPCLPHTSQSAFDMFRPRDEARNDVDGDTVHLQIGHFQRMTLVCQRKGEYK